MSSWIIQNEMKQTFLIATQHNPSLNVWFALFQFLDPVRGRILYFEESMIKDYCAFVTLDKIFINFISNSKMLLESV